MTPILALQVSRETPDNGNVLAQHGNYGEQADPGQPKRIFAVCRGPKHACNEQVHKQAERGAAHLHRQGAGGSSEK